jgi:hypothetical protein
MPVPDSTRRIELPADLCETVEQRFSAQFGGLEPFLTYVLQQLVRDESKQMDEAERRLVEERLRDLGYM